MKEFTNFAELHRIHNKLTQHFSPLNEVLKEQFKASNRLIELAYPVNKVIRDIDKSYANSFGGLTPFSNSPEFLKLFEMYNSEFYQFIKDSILFKEKIFPNSLNDNLKLIINNSSIQSINNLPESSIYSIFNNFKDIGVSSEFATISFLESIDKNEIDLKEEEVNELALETSKYLRDLFVNSNFIINSITEFLTKNPTIKLSGIVLIYFITEIISSCISVYIEKTFTKDDNQNIIVVNNNYSKENEYFKINTDNVLLKDKNSDNSKTITNLKLNTEIIVLKNNRKWAYIFVKNDQIISGWVRKEFIDFPEK